MEKKLKKPTLYKFFPFLSQAEVSALEASSSLIFLKKKENLFLAGDAPLAVYALINGYMKVVRENQEGETVITRVLSPGQIIGAREIFGNFKYYRTTIALRECEVLSIEKDAIFNLSQKNSSVALQFMKYFCDELDYLDKRIEADLYMPAKARIAAVIYELYRLFSVNTKPNSRTFESPLTRREIAQLADVTPETVSRVITEFKLSGALKTHGALLTLLDINAFL